MGVAASGKTTIGHALAQELGWEFIEGDRFHPPENIAKMTRGIALTDNDRWPWLDRIVAQLRVRARQGRDAVLACSALKQAYRDRLAQISQGARGETAQLRIVFLKGDAATIEHRLAKRSGHFMPPSLLASQFATLEEPRDALVIDIRQSVAVQVAQIAASLRSTA
ncbi:MAG: gluconokinase [Betaproteobacteria bacterium]|nr:MAG: gluconokinase [Betaproteobacteria bacterium]